MKIKLLTMTITNFKGIKSYTLDPQGEDISIAGQNGTGKSTIFDAFTWLLFGKNSQGQSKFWVKPRDEQGTEIEGTEPIVEASLDIDGKAVTLRRELKENWVQHRGEIERERKSDTTKLFIDGVPQKLNEYQSYIDGLISEDLFKLLTVPGAFNALKVADQRDMLMTLFQEVPNEEVIASNKDLSSLSQILDGQTVDDKRKTITYQRRELKKQVDGIPARIDEAERAKPEPQAKRVQLEEMQTVYRSDIAKIEKQIKDQQATDVDADRLKRIAEKKAELAEKRSTYAAGIETMLGGVRSDLDAAQKKVFTLRAEHDDLIRQVDDARRQAESLESQRQTLLSTYKAAKAVTFDESQTVCPTCHQELPAEQVDDLRERFNKHHSQELESLLKDGKATAQKVKEQQERQAAAEQADSKVAIDLQKAEDELKSIQADYEAKSSRVADFESTEEYKTISGAIAALESATASEPQADAGLTEKLGTLRRNLTTVEEDLAAYKQIEVQDKRIAELKQEEAELKQKSQELEGQDYLLQQFTRTKSHMIEDKLNALFTVVKFKLFDTQKDGTIVDTVMTTVDGIDYDAGLNTGAKMRAGLDIINALDRKHSVLAPIFIDNAEGLTNIFETDAQQIRLRVSKDKKLKVEE